MAERNVHDILMQEAVRRVVDAAEYWVDYITGGGKILPLGASPETKDEKAVRLAHEARMMPATMGQNPGEAQGKMAEIDKFMSEPE